MSCFIYTVAHPLTNDLVYVGMAKNILKRKQAHLCNTYPDYPMGEWIKEMKENNLIPVFEEIDEVPDDIAPAMETFWIHQLTCWGFQLLNMAKTIKKCHKKLRHKPRRKKNKKRIKIYPLEMDNTKNGTNLLF